MYLFFYQILVYLLQPFLLLRLICKGVFNRSYLSSIKQRYAFYSKKEFPIKLSQQNILVHAASVGEAMVAIKIIKELLSLNTNYQIIATVQTKTGKEILLNSKLPIQILFFPYDTLGSVKRLLNYIRPNLIIIIETELWINFINQANIKNIPIIIANARLSDKSLNNYLKFKKIFKQLLSKINLIITQDQKSANNYLRLIEDKSKVIVGGNIKYEIQPITELAPIINQYKQVLSDKIVWIAASTHQGEDEIILDCYKQLLKDFPNLYLILVPRHPQRFKQVEQLIKQNNFTYNLFSDEVKSSITVKQLLLVDSIGVLNQFYALAKFAFIGGSLVEIGGHNPLEAAVYKMPIIVGPYTFNFKEIYEKLKEGCLFVNDTSSMANAVTKILKDKKIMERLSNYNYKVVLQNQGSLIQLISEIKKLM